jgi:hypothetical protein
MTLGVARVVLISVAYWMGWMGWTWAMVTNLQWPSFSIHHSH